MQDDKTNIVSEISQFTESIDQELKDGKKQATDNDNVRNIEIENGDLEVEECIEKGVNETLEHIRAEDNNNDDKETKEVKARPQKGKRNEKILYVCPDTNLITIQLQIIILIANNSFISYF